MALDPNIILSGKMPDPSQPLETAANAIALKNKLIQGQTLDLQNQGLQQDYAARRAYGRILGDPGVTNPLTGQTDWSKFNAAASQDPDLAWKLPEIAKDNIDRQTGQAKLLAEQVNAHRAALGLVSGGLQNVLNVAPKPDGSPGDITDRDVMGTVTNIITNPSLSPELRDTLHHDAVQLLATLPPETQQAQRRAAIQNALAQTLTVQDQFDRRYPKPESVNVGGSTQFYTPSQMIDTGVQPAGSYRNTLTPEQQAAPRNMVNPVSNQAGYIPTSQWAQNNGLGGLVDGGGFIPPNGSAGGQNSAPAGRANGRTPGAPVAAAGGGVPNFTATEPIPGRKEAQVANAQSDAQAGQDAITASIDVRQNLMPLIKEAKAELDQGVTTGPTNKWSKMFGAFLAQGKMGDMQKTAANETLDKVLEQVAQKQYLNLSRAGGSDAKLGAAQSASPSSKLSTLGVRNTIATVEGQAKTAMLLGEAYQAAVNNGYSGSYRNFASGFLRDIDPFVFVVQSLPPDQQRLALQKMPPDARKAYNTSAAKLQQLTQAIGWKDQ